MIPSNVDHLVIAAPSLAECVEQCHTNLGVLPIAGGVHPGLGTANALLGLTIAGTRRVYLELIGPDPAQDPDLAAARLAGITEPTVQRWAIRPDDFDSAVATAAKSQDPIVDLGEVYDMSRRTPEGELLEWRLTRRTPLALGGIQPFLIDWKSSPHPSEQAMPAVELEAFWATSPDADETRSVLDVLAARIEPEAGVSESLHATLKGPGGSWTI